MSHTESTLEPFADPRLARITLIALIAAWAALAVWMLRHGEQLLAVARSEPSVARVVASGALPGDPVPERASEAAGGRGDESPGDVAARAKSGAEALVDGAGRDGAGEASVVDAGTDAVARRASGAGGPAEAVAAADASDTAEAVEPDAVAAIDPDGPAAEPPESVFEVRRREELATLEALLGQLRFEPLESTPSSTSREPLERAFEILFLYPDTRLALVVESRETNDPAFDRRLGRERAGTVVDYLVSRGIERTRLSPDTGDGGDLPFGEHRVRVSVEDENR